MIYDKYIFAGFFSMYVVSPLIIQTVLFYRVVWKGILFQSFFTVLNPCNP